MATKIKLDDQSVRITQNINDIKAGIKQNDLSRISAYVGSQGTHTGSNSETKARHNRPF